MAAIITERVPLNNAKQFVEYVTEATSATYTFIGRGHAWTDDASPPTPVDSPNDEFDAYRSMVALKKVATTDISHAIVRRDWTTSTQYDEYRHNYASGNTGASAGSPTTLWDSLFYVVTDDYNVYKCLSNGTADHTAANVSTVKPDHTTLATPTESDQYQWKYMYSISASDVIKFVTNDFIPIKTMGAQLAVNGGVDSIATPQNGRLGNAATDDGSAQWDVENGAVNGALDKARVVTSGSGYNNATTTGIAIRGDGTGGVCTVTVASTGVTVVTITTAGSGYTQAYVANEDIPVNDEGNQRADGTNASANIEFIIQPRNGHGADPIEELGGNYVILNSRLEYAEGAGDFPTDNDFRQIGVIVNPTDTNNALITAATAKAYKTMLFSATSFVAPTVDTLVRNADPETKTTAVGVVVSVDSASRIISYLPYPNEAGNFVPFANDDVIKSATQGSGTAHGTLANANAIVAEELLRHSGDIIYLENRGAVSRASDQIEDIKLIVEMQEIKWRKIQI